MVKALEMRFSFLGRRKKLVILAPTGFAAESNGGNTVYIALRVNTRSGKSYVSKINTQWSEQSSLIVDKVSMIDLKLLTSIDKHLQKVKRSAVSSITFLGGLLLVMLMRDFYQFVPVIERALWNKALGVIPEPRC